MDNIPVDPKLVVCTGASKAGTTTLFDLMRQHPAVSVTTHKETNFFFDDARYANGFPWFRNSCFPDSTGKQVLFEADPAYMCSRTSLERLRACDPAARIVMILRNPAERAFSQWLYHVQMGRSTETFGEAIAREPGRITAEEYSVNRWGYLERGRYGKYIAQLLEYFPREQTYSIVFERFVQDQAGEFSRLTSWLGLPVAQIAPAYQNPTGRPRSTLLARVMYDEKLRALRRTLAKPLGRGPFKQWVASSIDRLNVVPYLGGDKPTLDSCLREKILQDLTADITLTERLTGLDLSIWRSAKAVAA